MKNHKAIISIIIILILLSPKTVNFLKYKINESKKRVNEIKEISIGYGPNVSVLKYRQGFLIYDGKSIKYINNKAERISSLNIRIENYSIDTNGSNVYILDKTNKEVYIVDKKGILLDKIKTNENPVTVKSFKNGNFLVHYSTSVGVEGVAIFNSHGKEINNISIPKISINFISTDPYKGGFLLSGMSTEKDSLFNNIFYYDKKGNLIFSDNLENKLFMKALFIEKGVVLLEPKYIEFRDKDFNILNTLNLSDSIKTVGLINNYIGVLYDSKKLAYINENGHEKNTNYPIQNIKGFEKIGKEVVIYSDRSIYFTKYKKEYNLKEDIVKVIVLDEKNIIVLLRGKIKFLNLT